MIIGVGTGGAGQAVALPFFGAATIKQNQECGGTWSHPLLRLLRSRDAHAHVCQDAHIILELAILTAQCNGVPLSAAI